MKSVAMQYKVVLKEQKRVCVHTVLSSCVPKESREPESSGKANETEISVDCAGVERDRY